MRLQLFIPATWPHADSACAWQIIDDGGVAVRQGQGSPASWPGLMSAAQTQKSSLTMGVDVVLSAEQALFCRVRLPAGAARQNALVIAHAIEDKLLNDVSEYHCVAGAADADGLCPVLAMSRKRVGEILAALSSVGVEVQRMMVGAQRIAVQPNEAWLIVEAHGVCLRLDSGWLWADRLEDSLATPPPLLVNALAQIDSKPLRLHLWDAQRQLSQSDINAWQQALDQPLLPAVADAVTSAPPINLLQGEFALSRNGLSHWRSWHLVFKAAAVALAVFTLLVVGEWLWLGMENASLRSAQQAVLRTAVPDIGTINSPYLQMQQRIDAARAMAGRLGTNDFLHLLGTLLEAAPQVRIEHLNYEAPRLKARVTLANNAVFSDIQQALAARNITVQWGALQTDHNGVHTELSLTQRGIAP